jgi:hypothetical protein
VGRTVEHDFAQNPALQSRAGENHSLNFNPILGLTYQDDER